ncbi:unnamed protein product [Oppiella nova]|uniref:Chromo domain-containing protein n=1 Tax=Oppiella nova TaxID=334625 RepID=A0A7R9MEC5_9ACAR|nr:unnamed protein product [Oppiella nova]CAG2175691.1 unnamed protein product [Oppiella nova]
MSKKSPKLAKKSTLESRDAYIGGDVQEYLVERLLDKRVVRGCPLYLIKWQGFSDAVNTWEPINNLLPGCHHLIRAFEANHSHDTQEATQHISQDILQEDTQETHDSDATEVDSDFINDSDISHELSTLQLADGLTGDDNTGGADIDGNGITQSDTSDPQSTGDGVNTGAEESGVALDTSASTLASTSTATTGAIASEETPAYVARSEWPTDLIPERVIGVNRDSDLELWHFIEWRNSSEVSVMPSRVSNKCCPQLVIKFYENRVLYK